MTKEETLEIYNNPSTEVIYSFMHGKPLINISTPQGIVKERDKVIKISKESLQLSKNEDAFIYIWGWPGPDYNIYSFEDYGKTWAFEYKELTNET